MKFRYLLALGLLTLGSTAASAKPLARLVQSGGFCMGGCPTRTLTLNESGWVNVQVKLNTGAVQERKNISWVKPELIEAIKKEIATYKAAPLVDMQADQPICQDIPTVRYSAFQGEKALLIGEDRDCHQFRPMSFNGSRLIKILDGLSTLDSYFEY